MEKYTDECEPLKEILSDEDFESFKVLIRQIKKFDDSSDQIQRLIYLTFGETSSEKARRHKDFKIKLQKLEEIIDNFSDLLKRKVLRDYLERYICPHKFRNETDPSATCDKSQSDSSLSQNSFDVDCDRQRRFLDSDDEEEAQYGFNVDQEELDQQEKEKEEKRKLREQEKEKKRKKLEDDFKNNPANLLNKRRDIQETVEKILTIDMNPLESLKTDSVKDSSYNGNMRAEFGTNLNQILFMDKDQLEYHNFQKESEAVDYMEALKEKKNKKKNKKKKGKGKKKGVEVLQDEDGYPVMQRTYDHGYEEIDNFEVEEDMLNQTFMEQLGKNRKYQMHKNLCEKAGSNPMFP